MKLAHPPAPRGAAPPRPPPRALALGVLLLALAAPRPLAANTAPALFRGERHGPLAPQQSTTVRVDGETLIFDLAGDGRLAEVTATYRMTASVAERLPVAFVYVRALSARGEMRPIEASVTVDGAAIPFEAVSDAYLLEPRVRAWLAGHPEVEQALAGLATERLDAAGADRVARAAGAPCTAGAHRYEGCAGLRRWYARAGHPRWGEGRLDDAAAQAARDVVPDDVTALRRGWSTLEDDRGLGFFLFDLALTPGAHTVAVRYEHAPTRDRRAYAAGRDLYEYLLSPARQWASFGSLDVTIRPPAQGQVEAPPPFRREGDVYRASLAALPAGELSFSVVRTEGLWPGLTRHADYWALLHAAGALVALAAGVAVGRRAVALPAPQRALWCVIGAGVMATTLAAGTTALLLPRLPRSALAYEAEEPYPPPTGAVTLASGAIGVAAAVAAALATGWRQEQPKRRGGTPAPGHGSP